ncbi:MAG: caspase family protein [Myxococcales bacterium]|nr:caspase family protein [Myxococcales bacterium]
MIGWTTVLRLALSLLVVGMVSLSTRVQAAESGRAAMPPAPVLTVRRFALVVGANDGGGDRVVLRYAGSDAAAVSEVLQRFGGVEDGDHEALVDPTPEELSAALEHMAQRIRAARRGGQHIQFVFYYSGHSDEEGLLLGGRRMAYKELRRQVQEVPADVRIAVLDSCASGAFTRTKGGTKRAPFLLTSGTEVTGHAFLSSSSIDEAAQESDRIGGSFFTHYFTTGLRGAADVDGDRLITLSEAYQFAFDETLARTEATRGGAQHAAYDIQLAGTGDLIMTDLRQTSAQLELAPEVGGRIAVRRVGGELTAELYKPPGSGAVELALEPGRYQVSVDDGQDLWRSELTVADGGRSVLERDDLHKVQPESTVQRGGLAAPPAVAAEEIKDVPFNAGVLPPLSINGQDRSGKKLRNVASVAVAWSRVYRLDGVAVALGATVVDERMNGAQLSFGGNLAGRVDGAQISTGFNHAKLVSGVQAAAINHARVVEPGMQGGLVNVVGTMRGVQLGLVNVGSDVRGAQVGLLNFSGQTDAGVGLISITREGNVHPELSISDTSLVNLGLRFPARHTYSFLEVGVQPAGRGEGWQAGLGFGGRIALPAKLFLDLDLAGYAYFHGVSELHGSDILAKLRMTFGYQPFERLSVFGGPTLNTLIDFGLPQDLAQPGLYQWSALDYTHTGSEVRVRVWPGFVAGVRF